MKQKFASVQKLMFVILMIVLTFYNVQSLDCYRCQNVALTKAFSSRFRFASNSACSTPTGPTAKTPSRTCSGQNKVCGYIKGQIDGNTRFGELEGSYERRGCFPSVTTYIAKPGMCREIILDASRLLQAIPKLVSFASAAKFVGTLCTCQEDNCAAASTFNNEIPSNLMETRSMSPQEESEMYGMVMEDMCMMVTDTEDPSMNENCTVTDPFPETAAQTGGSGSIQPSSFLEWTVATTIITLLWTNIHAN